MPTYTDIYANLRKGSSSLTVNEFPRFISENDKHLRVNRNIFTNIIKIFDKKIPSLKKYRFYALFRLGYCHHKDIKNGYNGIFLGLSFLVFNYSFL